MKPDGSYTILPTIPEETDETPSNLYCRIMMAGDVLPSDLGFPAMVSFYGATDWVAYIGSHLFSKAVFTGVAERGTYGVGTALAPDPEMESHL